MVLSTFQLIFLVIFDLGCCDCGDTGAWSPNGFCHRHGKEAADPVASIPKEIRETAQPLLETIAIRIVDFCESYSRIFELDSIALERVDTKRYFVVHLDDLHR